MLTGIDLYHYANHCPPKTALIFLPVNFLSNCITLGLLACLFCACLNMLAGEHSTSTLIVSSPPHLWSHVLLDMGRTTPTMIIAYFLLPDFLVGLFMHCFKIQRN